MSLLQTTNRTTAKASAKDRCTTETRGAGAADGAAFWEVTRFASMRFARYCPAVTTRHITSGDA